MVKAQRSDLLFVAPLSVANFLFIAPVVEEWLLWREVFIIASQLSRAGGRAGALSEKVDNIRGLHGRA